VIFVFCFSVSKNVDNVKTNKTVLFFFFQNNVNQTVNYHLYKSKIKSLRPDKEDLQEERQRYSAKEISWMGENFQKVICNDSDSINNRITIDVQLYVDNNTNLNTTDKILNECNKRCIITVSRNAMCSNINMELEYNINLTFWLYLVIRVFIGKLLFNISIVS